MVSLCSMGLVDDIRAKFRESGRTAKDIASQTGIHVVNLSRFRTGAMGLSLENLEKLAHALEIEIVTRPVRKKK